MMKYTRATHQRSRDPVDILYKRLLDMMNDHDISLREAIEWDMLGFMPYEPKSKIILTPEEEVDYYLHTNYISDENRVFFSGVALGYFPDYGLTDEEETEQKDTGSPSTP